MKIRYFAVTALATAGIAFMPAAPTFAACNNGSSQQVDENGDATGEDTVVGADQTPTGTTVYSDGESYAGTIGSHGFIEVSSEDGVDGSSTDAPVEGSAGPGGVCLNDTVIV